MTDKRTALVLGATGGIGGEVALALLQGGWHVRSLHREPERAAARCLTWLACNGSRATPCGARTSLRPPKAPMSSCTASIHPAIATGTASPADARELIAAAKASGARLVFPGTVYNFGPDAFPALSERSPQNPTTRKGTIRVEMERRLRPPAGTACARSSSAPATSSGRAPATAGLRKAWSSRANPSAPSLSGPARCRPRLGVPARPGGDHRPAARSRGGAGRLRRLPLRWPLVRARHRDGPCHQRGSASRAAPIRRFPGSGFRCSVRSSPYSARCWRCATSGSARCGSTTRSSSRSWARSRTRRSTPRYVPRWLDWAACPTAMTFAQRCKRRRGPPRPDASRARRRGRACDTGGAADW